MPTYDYRCDECEHTFEAFHGISAEPLSACPECGSAGLRRLIGPGQPPIFKGSGFYETDYRRAPPRAPAVHQRQATRRAPAGGSPDPGRVGPPPARTS